MGFYDTEAVSVTCERDQKTAYPRLDFVESGMRYYNSAIGRWANRDPIGEPGFDISSSDLRSEEQNAMRSLRAFVAKVARIDSAAAIDLKHILLAHYGIDLDQLYGAGNLYSFVHGGPISRIDPFGLEDKDGGCPTCPDIDAQKKLLKKAIDGLVGIATDSHPKLKVLKKLVDTAKDISDKNKSLCSDMEKVQNKMADCKKTQSVSVCYFACKAIADLLGMDAAASKILCTKATEDLPNP